MLNAKYKIMEHDLGWIVYQNAMAVWCSMSEPFTTKQAAEAYLLDTLRRIEEEKVRQAQREASASFYDARGYPVAFAGAGAAGVRYGYGAGDLG